MPWSGSRQILILVIEFRKTINTLKNVDDRNNNNIIVSFHADLSPPLGDRLIERRTHDVQNEGNLHLHPRDRDRHEAPRLYPTRSALDPDIRFFLGFAPIRDRVLAVHGLFCQRQKLSILLCQRLHGLACYGGDMEVLVREKGGGFGLGLA
ncbi:hypothetical protein V6N11_003135 [Hibiscus sabdariffa]|uniref:Uncharacterized protein n=1 Tax=Hibiscus sabdariffa TaxID=183260 RepID=A0ABR2SD87_9ROSI